MKYLASRFVIFPLLGPLVGLAVLVIPFFIEFFLGSTSTGPKAEGSGKLSGTSVCLMITAAAYGVGLLPAVAAAIADWHFADDANRVLRTSVVGCLSSMAFMSVLLRGRLDVIIILAAMAGAAAACACSLLHRSLHPHRHPPV